jgi:hypothetical protein
MTTAFMRDTKQERDTPISRVTARAWAMINMTAIQHALFAEVILAYLPVLASSKYVRERHRGYHFQIGIIVSKLKKDADIGITEVEDARKRVASLKNRLIPLSY